jgi:hypothetical protein
MTKNTQTSLAARFGYFEPLSQLGPLPIPNIIPAINFGTYSNLNLLFILKGVQTFWKISENFSKILSGNTTSTSDMVLLIQDFDWVLGV